MSMAEASAQKARRFPIFPRRLFNEFVVFGALCWAGFALVMLLIPIGVSFVRPIEFSGWSMVQQVIAWFALFIGFHVGWGGVEQYVTHGQSRRTFLKSVAIFVFAWSAAMAALSAATYFPEALIYNIAGWPQQILGIAPYDNVLHTPLVFLDTWLTLALWTAGGFALGIGWYRGTLAGTVSILLCLLMAGLSGLSSAQDEGPLGFLVRESVLPQEPQLWLALVVHLACTAALLAFSWWAGRDVPIKKKVT